MSKKSIAITAYHIERLAVPAAAQAATTFALAPLPFCAGRGTECCGIRQSPSATSPPARNPLRGTPLSSSGPFFRKKCPKHRTKQCGSRASGTRMIRGCRPGSLGAKRRLLRSAGEHESILPYAICTGRHTYGSTISPP